MKPRWSAAGCLMLCAAGAPAHQHTEPPAPSVTGVVEDAAGAPVPGATVVLVDAATGLPLLRGTYKPFGYSPGAAESDMAGRDPEYATVTTDAAGRFAFAGVPAGEVRLIAQSWVWSDEALRRSPPKPGEARQPDEPAASLFAVNGDIIHLRGVSSDITIEPDAPAPIEVALRPLGNDVLTIDCGAGNDETLLVLSTSPTSADPILGFAGWTGPFLEFAIGINRMPKGKTTIRGLPHRTVHLAIFSADNNPGWGAGSVDMVRGTPLLATVPFVAAWSDAVHSPPDRLKDLTDELRRDGITTPAAAMELLTAAGVEVPRPEGGGGSGAMIAAMAELGRLVGTPIKLPSGREVPTGDLLAATAYISLASRHEQAGRPVNPWRGVEVRQTPPDRP